MSLQRIQEMNILVEPAAAAMLEGAHPAVQSRAVERLSLLQAKPLVLDAPGMRKLLLPDMRRLKRAERPAELSVNAFSAAWSARFAALQQLLLKKPEATGAVSIAAANGRCTIVGQVKKAKQTELEDPTGSIELVTAARLLPDDVVAATGRAEGGAFRAEDVIFPDMPLKAAPSCSGTLGINTEGDFTVTTGGTEWLDVGGMTILVHKADWKALADSLSIPETQVPIELLRRRHLASPPWDLIEHVPDLFVAIGIEKTSAAYKGTAVICAPEKALIDLAAREET